VVSIFAYSVNLDEAFSKLAVFLLFGLGFGLPLLALSLLSGATQRWFTRLVARRARLVNLVAGLLLIGVGAVDLYNNRELLARFMLGA
jgi:cytochrome c biogenesis protein CcdA